MALDTSPYFIDFEVNNVLVPSTLTGNVVILFDLRTIPVGHDFWTVMSTGNLGNGLRVGQGLTEYPVDVIFFNEANNPPIDAGTGLVAGYLPALLAKGS